MSKPKVNFAELGRPVRPTGWQEGEMEQSDQVWLAEVRRASELIESGQVEAPEGIRESISYILEDPERFIAESEAMLNDPDLRRSLEEDGTQPRRSPYLHH